MVWVEKELIPPLDLVYNVETGYTAKTHEEWETEVAHAEKRINTIRNYDDNIITIDRIRLTLTSSPNIDAEDRAQVLPISDDQDDFNEPGQRGMRQFRHASQLYCISNEGIQHNSINKIFTLTTA